MKVAALDLGSNTYLMLVVDIDEKSGRIIKVYRDELEVTRMGQGVHASKKFHPEALARADECFKKYAEILRVEKPEKILAMATSAARDVTNADELLKIGNKYNIPIEIIPGEMEAQITFDGSTVDDSNKSGIAVIDVGGGSTEVIGADKTGKALGASANVGSVRLTELFVTQHPVPKQEVEKILQYSREKFNEIKHEIPQQKFRKVVAVAGTPTTLSAVIQKRPYEDEYVDGSKLTLKELHEWLWKLAAMPLEDRKKLPGMDPRRADVIVAGISILIAAIETLGADEMVVSTKGVRYGVALLASRR